MKYKATVRVFGYLLAVLSPTLLLSLASARPPLPQDPNGTEFFENRIRPLLAARCYGCHSSRAGTARGGLLLDSRAAWMRGGGRGPAIVPNHPETSLLIRAVRYGDGAPHMPPAGRLPDAEIALLTEWVTRGALAPQDRNAGSAATVPPAFDLKQRRRHWAWQPIRKSPLPRVKNRAWPQSPIDTFILARLEAAGLTPAPPADRRTLLRRVTYDLIGLPPTPAEINAFLHDGSPDAYRKVVDRLLASPHYGERWARHWLDLVRFAETDGHEFDTDKPGAYRYRDYVIRALNADLPYDQFVREQIAGDLLPHPRRHPTEGFDESIIGTGFWWLGERDHSPVDVAQNQADRIDNQIDVLSKALLGLSVGCARCHDHKFDAISTRDYYALSGYLKSSRYQLAAIDPPDRLAPTLRSLEKITARIEALLETKPNFTPSPLHPEGRVPQVRAGHTPSVLFEDFSATTWKDWYVTGEAFGPGPRRVSFSATQADGGPRVERIAGPGVADSGCLADKLQGALRSRTFTISKPKILYHMAGRDAVARLIVDGFQRIQNPIYGGLEIRPDDERRLKWYTQDVGKWVGHRAYIEFLDPGPGRIVVDRILFSDQDAPAESASHAPSLAALSAGPEHRAALAGLLEQRRALEQTIPEPQLVLAMADGTGENDRVHIRGNHKTLGAEVPRRFLEACAGPDQPVPVEGSGRLALAERIVAPSDPLLPRVLVNRLWQHHFGEGIVRTPDDFGVMGQRPTHPELLDYLAAEFVRGGWSLKKLHRLMVLSSAYQMSSRPIAKAESADPQNRLLHRMPVRRLEAEIIRDAILAVSGRLDPTLFGPSVPPYLTPLMEGRGRPETSGPLDGAGRRSIYLNVRRNFLNPMFLAFDYPVPFTCIGKRTVSNVPAQALALLNNPFVVQQAHVWAERVLADTGKTAQERIATLYLTAFGRPPDAQETAAARAFLAAQDSRYRGHDDLRSWTDLCHVLFNVKEFIFVN